MDLAWILPFLALVSLAAFMIFALVSKERTERRLQRSSEDKTASSLAADGSDHTVAD